MNTINDIYQKIKKLYKESVVDIDSLKFINKRKYRLIFNCDKISDKGKFKNINNVFNNGYCSIDTIDKNKINKNISKSQGIDANYKSAVIVKHKEIIANKIFKCFGLNITGNIKETIDMYYISFNDLEKNYQIEFRIFPQEIMIQIIHKEKGDFNLVQLFQNQEKIQYTSLITGEKVEDKTSGYNKVRVLIDKLEFVEDNYKIDVLNYLLFGSKKEYNNEEKDSFYITQDNSLPDIEKEEIFIDLSNMS